EDLGVLARLAVVLATGDTVTEHDFAERAAGGDLRRSGTECLIDPIDVDAFADLLFHPHAGTARAAAHRAVGVPRHLPVLCAGGLDEVTGRLVNLVVSTDEARVVVGDIL